MILAAQKIEDAYKSGAIVIEPFDAKQVQAASYDLRVGEEGATTCGKKIVNIREAGFLLLQPGDLGVIVVYETIRLGPQYAGRFGLRSKYARKGLIATTGLQVDPGYHGRLRIVVANLTPEPISLPYKDDFVSLELHRLDEATTKPYSGAVQDQTTLTPNDVAAVTETNGMAFSEVIMTLRSVSANVGALSSEVRTLRWAVPLIVGIGMAVVGAIVALK